MSDFGVAIQIFRKDGEDFTGADRRLIARFIEAYPDKEELTSHAGDPFEFDLRDAESESGTQGVSILLSEYWLDDANLAGTDMEGIVEEDRETGETFFGALVDEHADRFELELYAGVW